MTGTEAYHRRPFITKNATFWGSTPKSGACTKAKEEPGSSVTGSNAKSRSLVHGYRSMSPLNSTFTGADDVTTEPIYHRIIALLHELCTVTTILCENTFVKQLHASTFAFTSQVRHVNAYCYCRLSTNIFLLKPCIDHNCSNTFSFCSKNCTREKKKKLWSLWHCGIDSLRH